MARKWSNFILNLGTAGPATFQGIRDLGFALVSDFPTQLAKFLRVDQAQAFTSPEKLQGRSNLGLGTISTQDASNVAISGGSIAGIADLAIADGGTGASNASTARTNLGLGNVDNTSDANKPVSTAQQTALNLKANLASPPLTGTPTAPTAAFGTNTTQLATTEFVQANAGNIVSATAQATTSGTTFDFNSLAAGIKRVTVIFDQVSLTGTEDLLVQLGTSAGLETTGYFSGSGGASTSTAGLIVRGGNAARTPTGQMVLTRLSGNTWVESHVVHADAASEFVGGGRKVLAGVLDRLRLTRTGADTFDGGSVNILYEF